MISLKKSFLYTMMMLSITGCTKTYVLNDPPPDPPVEPPPSVPYNPDKPNGILYLDLVGTFVKINTSDSSIIWTTEKMNPKGSFDNRMYFDSTSFYHGNYFSINAYSTQTGIPRWSFIWHLLDDAISYGEPAFNDSLAFIAAPNSGWSYAFLVCLNKTNGTLYWKKQIDWGDLDIRFTTTPMVVGNNVIVLTRDANSNKRITAFNISDASQQWTSEINNNLSFKHEVLDGKIYSWSKYIAYCYEGTDGTLKWQTDLESSGTPEEGTRAFFEGDKQIIVKIDRDVYNVITLDRANGSIIKKSTLRVPHQMHDPVHAPITVNYSDNKLYVTTRYNLDTVSVRSYDLSNLALRWEKRFAHYLYAGVPTLVTNKYVVFPINYDYPGQKSTLYFLDLNKGDVVTGIPIHSSYVDVFSYMEDGVMYTLPNHYSTRY